MGIIARNEHQFTLIYSSNTRVGTHTLSYLTAIEDKLLAIDIAKTKVSDSQWAEIAETLGVKIGDLVDKRALEIEVKNTADLGSDDWLKIIQNNDAVITQPIAINGSKTMQITNPTEVLQFFDVDSAGLEKTMHTEKPDIERNNKGEDFV